MKFHKLIILILSFSTFTLSAQDNSKWMDLLSYRETSDLSIWGNKILVASEYSVFIYDKDDNSLAKFSKLNGLLGERITAIKALTNDNVFVVGYDTGDFTIVYSDGKITQVNDIAISGVAENKMINAIEEYGDKIYLATTFGIVEYNIVKEEFGDTFYFGDNGGHIYVNDIAFIDHFIYAATDNGVFKADIWDPFLVDYNQWELQNVSSTPNSKFNSIASINRKIIVNKAGDRTVQFKLIGTVWSQKNSYYGVTRIRSNDEYITFSADDKVIILDKELVLVEILEKDNLGAQSALRTGGTTWIATKEDGLAKNENSTDWKNIYPNGPNKNYPFRIKVSAEKMYVVYGYYDQRYTPKHRKMGYDIFDSKDWSYVEPSIFDDATDLSSIAIDPKDPDHIYISSWSDGVLEMQDKEKIELWVEDNTNKHIQKLFYAPDPTYVSIRIGGSTFDDDGNLWVANGWNVDRPFVVRMASGDWNSFALNKISSGEDYGMAEITIDQNGNKWIATRKDGIWIYNENGTFDSTSDDYMLKFTTSEGSGNLPNSRVNSIAIDKENNAWIGTKMGLVVFRDINSMFDDTYFKAEPIIINENGVGKKLLGNQIINKILVDGANNKWFATESGGVYYTSSNGQKTIHHFTKENSPLLSNRVFDIGINPETGRVYFVTSKGLISYLGTATEGGNSFSKVFAYPNPVRPDYDGDIYIKGLTDKTNIKITDINGNLIFETTSEGGQAVWNGRSLSGYKASSGVYVVFAVSKDGTDTTVTKILIVN